LYDGVSESVTVEKMRAMCVSHVAAAGHASLVSGHFHHV